MKGHLGPGLWALYQVEEVRTSRDIPGCEGTLGTWDFGHCTRWERLRHPGISQDVKGPGTSGWDRLGHPGDIPGS